MLEDRLIWQPVGIHQSSCDFGILLDRKFSEEMLSLKINEITKKKMNDSASNLLPKDFNPNLHFFKNTGFVAKFNLGYDGRTLEIEGINGKSPLEVFSEGMIKYSSHNVTTTIEAYGLMTLVDFWIEYSEVLRDLSEKA